MKQLLTIFLTLFLAISIVVRFYRLDILPLALSNDEISIAYDAYSLLHTGRDQHGSALPVSFGSLGIVKAPGYTYLLSPFLAFLPHSNATARLPSSLAGLITIIAVFLIASKLTRSLITGLFSALVISVSPWHIISSRMVLEANVALMFLSLGVAAFIMAKSPKSLSLSALLLALSLYSYHSEWLLVPLLIFLFIILYLPRYGSRIYALPLTFALLCLPLLIDYKLKTGSGLSLQSQTQMIFNNTSYGFLQTVSIFIRNYLGYLNPGYLFFKGMGLYPAPHIFESGLFLPVFILPFVIGLFTIKKLQPVRIVLLISAWAALSPTVSALTTGDPNPRRDLVSLLPYSLIIAWGLTRIFKFHQMFLFGLLTLLFGSFIMFTITYFYSYPRQVAARFPIYRTVSDYLQNYSSCHHMTVVDFRYGISHELTGVPHLYLAFYQHLDPAILQYRLDRSGGLVFSRYQVTRIDWDRFTIRPGYLYVVPAANTPPPEFRTRLKLIKQFSDTANTTSMEIWGMDCQ